MSAGWVAGSVRAQAMAARHRDRDRARRLAACQSLSDALRDLSATSYGRGGLPDRTLAGAQQAIAAAILWNVRVLAGWLPREGVQMLRILAGWFEIANTDELLRAMADQPGGEEFRLGALATAWPRLRQASSLRALRASLAASPWRDPGEDTARAVGLAMRARWAARVAGHGDTARTWAAGAAALLLAGERFTAGRPVNPAVLHTVADLLGPAAARAATLGELARGLPPHARWALAGIGSPDDLWQAEAAWWRRVEQDGSRLLRAGPGHETVLGAVAVMGADARRTSAALEIAARGGQSLEAYDAVA